VNYLLDTDTFNHFHRGQSNVVKRAAAIGTAKIGISVVTRLEVLQGRFEFVRKAATGQLLLIA
jgi:tRNA(fMet)-specific endonuclease VapC